MIEVKNLVKCYGGTQRAVDGLNFTIEKGQIVGFLGPNGAGKSTTMNMITGYISATEGSVIINGFDILKEPEKAKACIGYLPEQPPLYMDMTVLEYLKFVASLKGVKKADRMTEVNYAMNATKIIRMERRLIKNLSKGFKQRVGLAATLLGNPQVLILDEPTVGLDPMQIIEIRELITSLAQKHTVILSSHILQEISAVCDRVIIINKGKLVMDEVMANLDDNVANSECLSVTVRTSSTNLSGLIKKNFSVDKLDVENSEDEGCVDAKIYVKNREDIREKFYQLMADNKLPVLKLVVEKMSLEDIFLSATKEEDETDTRKKKKDKAKEKDKTKTSSSVISIEHTSKKADDKKADDKKADDKKAEVKESDDSKYDWADDVIKEDNKEDARIKEDKKKENKKEKEAGK